MVADYYAMLGVDPKADRATIDAALNRCQPKWSAGTRNPKNKHTFQSYLDQIPAIRQALLGEPSARVAYDAERAEGLRAERDRTFAEVQRLIRLRSAKGGLTVADRDRLRAEATRRGLTVDELDRLIEPIPPRAETARAEEEASDAPVDAIDPATRRQIGLALEHLRRRDLYDVLGLPRDAPTKELILRADEERQRWMRKSQVTAEKTAWLEAVSYAQSHLASPSARSRYDRTLVIEAEDAFDGAAQFALEGEPRIEAGTRQALLEEAAKQGITAERAERLIRRKARALGVAIDPPPTPTNGAGPARWLRCRTCGGVTEFARASRSDPPSCRHCGEGLQWSCPVCQRSRWVDEARCACGFAIELREPLLRHFDSAQQAHKARDYAAALAHLHRVQEFAPQHVGTRKAVERVKQRLAEIDDLRSRFAIDLERRHLLAALETLRQWSQLVDPTSAELKQAQGEVGKGLREARGRAARAEVLLATEPAEARRLFREALSICADLAEAREGLARCAPDPPSDLRAEVFGQHVRLRWSPPLADGLGTPRFRVVRKQRAVPGTSTDGQVVAEVEAAECDDPGVEPGSVVGYAVYSRRGAIESTTAAVLGPLLVLADVADVRADVRSGTVELSWSLPDGAAGVQVVRKSGAAPTGSDDGQPIEALRDGARDAGLPDDRVYHYGIYALYRAPDGKTRSSKGVTIAAMPHRPVDPIVGIELEQRPDGRLRITWNRPDRGQVRILRTTHAPHWKIGDRLEPAQVDALGGRWMSPAGPGAADDADPIATGTCTYTALTDWGGSLTVGAGRSYSSVPDPTDLRAVRGPNGRTYLRWRWSPQCAQSLVVYRAGQAPSAADDPQAHRLVVLETDYGRQGSFPLSLSPSVGQSVVHVTVYSLAAVNGSIATSPGTEPTARIVLSLLSKDVILTYQVQRPRFSGKTWSIAFHTDPPNSPIPPLVLVGHDRTVPLAADDGETIDRIDGGVDGFVWKIRNPKLKSDLRLRVFVDPCRAAEAGRPVLIRHPEQEATRI